ncbi:helix-turn-helix transcriptional regulator [Amycolatopsis aidingensis]|uniref:helix-turn-helix transcriptional regulator n=1 Tax=Amycolatopsis aidingensis TaxID=2842453 RepID=UPI001C0C6DAF|nr:LuxR family transcriptional regulator [Amycolatopsis aidingensis]
MTGTAARPLRGREPQLSRLTELLRRAGAGRGGALRLLGGMGTGKTALLEAARATATGFQVLSAPGVRAEQGLPLGALHRLLQPVGGPPPGLEAATFARCRGVHDLLVRLAGPRPLLCLADDAHWWDETSLAALTFAARRLAEVPVAVVLAERAQPGTGGGADPAGGIPAYRLAPLGPEAGDRLLRDALGPGPPRAVRTGLVELAAGIPGDLLELAGALSSAQAAGRAPLPATLPLTGAQRTGYRRSLAGLGPKARHLVLLAACEPRLPETLLARCPGIDPAARVEGLASGLLQATDDTVRALSPVLRATLRAEADAAELRRAHATLARALGDPHGGGGVRSAWHRAAASAEPAARLGDALHAAAETAVRVGDHENAADAFERAAGLGARGAIAAGRLVAAARSAWSLGRTGWARSLLRRARTEAGPDGPAGQISLLHGEIELRDGEPAVAAHELLAAARELEQAAPEQAAIALLLAGEAWRLGGDLAGYAQAAELTRQADQPDAPATVALLTGHFAGMAATFAGEHLRARPALERALRAARELGTDLRAQLWASEAAFALGRTARAYELAAAAVARARMAGETAALPWALVQHSHTAGMLDLHQVALRSSTEGLAAAEVAGQRTCAAEHRVLLAFSAAQLGDADAALEHLAAVEPDIARHLLGRPSALASWTRACLDLLADQPGEALARLRTLDVEAGHAQPAITVLATPHLVEIAVRAGEPERARRALRVFDDWALATHAPQWLALSERCHGLLATEAQESVRHFRAALSLHRAAGTPLELAKTQLAYARRLRRDRRTRAAREMLWDAGRLFERQGAGHWARRAWAELRAAGGTAAHEPRADPAVPGLTPQQNRIALLVAGGETNREIARRLVISHRTVDHHLRNIFAKLGVRSRVQLVALLASQSS